MGTHITESPDGHLTVWIDAWLPPRVQFANNAVRGQLLNHIATSDGRIALMTNNVTGLPFRYEEEISPDSSRMTGEWTSPGGPMSSLPSMFVRFSP